jgi:GR25 family glycosyltransferase involved in LPS biosynthesis
MKAFIITLSKIPASLATATAMIAPLASFGLDVTLFEGVYGDEAVKMADVEKRTLHPIDHNGTPTLNNFKVSGPGALGCFYSHYNLWKRCVELDEPVLIFEDDVKIIRPFYPVTFDEILIVAIGSWKEMIDIYKEPIELPAALPYSRSCLPGAVGYVIMPTAAKKLISEFKNTYTAADSAVRSSIVKLQIHSHIIGKALDEADGKTSLTKSKHWITK